jgi:hypothetical protein
MNLIYNLDVYKNIEFLKDTVELHLPGRCLSGSPIVRIGLALQLILLRILRISRSSTVPCCGL